MKKSEDGRLLEIEADRGNDQVRNASLSQPAKLVNLVMKGRTDWSVHGAKAFGEKDPARSEADARTHQEPARNHDERNPYLHGITYAAPNNLARAN